MPRVRKSDEEQAHQKQESRENSVRNAARSLNDWPDWAKERSGINHWIKVVLEEKART